MVLMLYCNYMGGLLSCGHLVQILVHLRYSEVQRIFSSTVFLRVVGCGKGTGPSTGKKVYQEVVF